MSRLFVQKWLILLVVGLATLLVFAACDDDDDEDEDATPPVETVEDGGPPSAEGPLKIGLLVAFTGDLSDFGPAHENAARLAANQINAGGGVLGQDIEIVTGDTGTDPSQGVTEANRLVNVEGVHAILGALSSGVTLQVAESVTGANSILQISPASTSPALSEANDNDFLFRTTISDAAQGIVLADQLAGDELGLTSVCTMFINNAYGEGLSEVFASTFEAGGGTVSAQIPHESEQPTYASELGECTEGSPDAVAALAYPESAGVFLREAAESDFAGSYLFVDGTKSEDMFAELGWPDAFNGSKGTAPFALDLPTGQAFDDAFAAEFGETPPLPFMREMYDAVHLVALAAEAAGSTDPTAIRDALRDVSSGGETVEPGTEGFAAALEMIAAGADINYEGAAGPVDLDENGDTLVGAIEIWSVDTANQTLVTERVFRIDLATGEVTEVELPPDEEEAAE